MSKINKTEEIRGCAPCGSYLSTTVRFGQPVCDLCAHMIDAHGARLADAFANDPCEAE
jgi:hypothetical protein